MKNRCVGGSNEGLLRIHAQPNHGSGPCSHVLGIAAGVLPENGTCFIGELTRKRALDLDESLPNELIDLCSSQVAHCSNTISILALRNTAAGVVLGHRVSDSGLSHTNL